MTPFVASGINVGRQSDSRSQLCSSYIVCILKTTYFNPVTWLRMQGLLSLPVNTAQESCSTQLQTLSLLPLVMFPSFQTQTVINSPEFSWRFDISVPASCSFSHSYFCLSKAAISFELHFTNYYARPHWSCGQHETLLKSCWCFAKIVFLKCTGCHRSKSDPYHKYFPWIQLCPSLFSTGLSKTNLEQSLP